MWKWFGPQLGLNDYGNGGKRHAVPVGKGVNGLVGFQGQNEEFYNQDCRVRSNADNVRSGMSSSLTTSVRKPGVEPTRQVRPE